MPLTALSVNVIGADIVKAKLVASEPRILAENRAMVQTMLDYIKPIVVENTPLGPGHFGYHLRDRYVTDVKSSGLKTIGVLKSPPQGYWREYGTRGHFSRRGSRRAYAAKLGAFGAGGEPALMIAHHALTGIKRFISFYYGKAQWWRL